VLDVGCGCGRVARALVPFFEGKGRYIGFDPAAEPVEWCKTNIESRHANFRFLRLDVRSPSYNPSGTIDDAAVRFPCDSNSIDVVVLWSIFTHMLPPAVERYASEIQRVLRPGGTCLVSHLLMNDAARRAVAAGTTIFDLRHELGPCTAFDAVNPTAGLAYDEEFAQDVLRRNGLEIVSVTYGDWREKHSYRVEHDIVVARKPA
jgi:SAM-dependent methyltransferase